MPPSPRRRINRYAPILCPVAKVILPVRPALTEVVAVQTVLLSVSRERVYPISQPVSSGKCGFEIVARGSLSGVRVCAPPRWRLSMLWSRGGRVTIGRIKLRPPSGRDKRGLCGGHGAGYSPHVIKSRNFRGSRRLCKSQFGCSRPLYYPPSCLYPRLDFRFHPQTRG